MVFEVGGYFEHSNGLKIHVLAELITDIWGKALIAECIDEDAGVSFLNPIKNLDDSDRNAGNWSKISQEEWEAEFDEQG